MTYKRLFRILLLLLACYIGTYLWLARQNPEWRQNPIGSGPFQADAGRVLFAPLMGFHNMHSRIRGHERFRGTWLLSSSTSPYGGGAQVRVTIEPTDLHHADVTVEGPFDTWSRSCPMTYDYDFVEWDRVAGIKARLEESEGGEATLLWDAGHVFTGKREN